MRDALEAVFPVGTDVYVALFTVAPTGDGSSYTELDAAWYSRVGVQDWLYQEVGDTVVRRINKSTISMGTNSGDDVTLTAIGIFDASSAGNLLAWQPILSVGGVEVPLLVESGDDVEIPAEELKIGLGPEEDVTVSAVVTTEDSVQTTDATPTVIRKAADLTDLRATHIVAEVWARENGLGVSNHYYRKIVKSYERNDGGSGSTLWTVRDGTTADGAATRVGFTSATADLVLTGNRVDLQVTGEAGTTIDWECRVQVISES